MNERIKELAEQATTKLSFRLDPTTYKHIDDPEGDFERVEFDKEKFAELIVGECVSIVSKRKDQAIDDGWNVDEAMSIAGMDLKEHFGVEE